MGVLEGRVREEDGRDHGRGWRHSGVSVCGDRQDAQLGGGHQIGGGGCRPFGRGKGRPTLALHWRVGLLDSYSSTLNRRWRSSACARVHPPLASFIYHLSFTHTQGVCHSTWSCAAAATSRWRSSPRRVWRRHAALSCSTVCSLHSDVCPRPLLHHMCGGHVQLHPAALPAACAVTAIA